MTLICLIGAGIGKENQENKIWCVPLESYTVCAIISRCSDKNVRCVFSLTSYLESEKKKKTLLKSQCPEMFLPAFNPINQPCYNFNFS